MKLPLTVFALALTGEALGKLSSTVRFHCATSYDSTSTNVVPRTTYTRRVTGTTTVRVQVTSTSTITPKPLVRLTTSTVTKHADKTLPQITDVSTSTVYSTSTSTLTLPTSTITSTFSTSTVSTSTFLGTTTIASDAGFVPVQSSLPSATARKRDVSERAAAEGQSIIPNAKVIQAVIKGDAYPEAVTCYRQVYFYSTRTVTRTAEQAVTTTLARATMVRTKRVTSTSTSTHMLGNAISTTTITLPTSTTVDFVPTTVTSTTTTTTVTATTATASAYAICQDAGNFASLISGFPIYDVQTLGTTSVFSSNITGSSTPSSCCNLCAANPLCGFTAFYTSLGGLSKCINALVGTPDQCESQASNKLTALYDPNNYLGSTEYTLSNGGCAEFTMEGPSLAATLQGL